MRRALPVANIPNMKEAFDGYMRHDDRVSIHGLAPAFRHAEDRSRMRTTMLVHTALQKADKQLMGHGVEEISGTERGSMFTAAYYVNMGDTYAPTIIYDVLANRFYVGDWGSWMEWRETNSKYGLQGEADF